MEPNFLDPSQALSKEIRETIRCRQRATRRFRTSCRGREGIGRVPLLRGCSATLRTRRIISRPRRGDVSDDCAHTVPTTAGGLWPGSSRIGSLRELSALSWTGIKVREGFFSTVLARTLSDLSPPGRSSSDCRFAARVCARQHLRQATRARCTGARVGVDRHPNVQYVLFPQVTDASPVLTPLSLAVTYVGCYTYLRWSGDPHPFAGPPGVRLLLALRGFIGFFGCVCAHEP